MNDAGYDEIRLGGFTVHLSVHLEGPVREMVEEAFAPAFWSIFAEQVWDGPEVDAYIFPRSMEEQAHESFYRTGLGNTDPFPGSYSYRAFAVPWGQPKPYVLMLADQTETTDSFRWLFLHEITHLAMPGVLRNWLNLEADASDLTAGFEVGDDRHEIQPEERVANAVATTCMGGRYFGRDWWRPRVQAMVHGEAAGQPRLAHHTRVRMRRVRALLARARSLVQEEISDVGAEGEHPALHMEGMLHLSEGLVDQVIQHRMVEEVA